MEVLKQITPELNIRIADLFKNHRKVDLSVESINEGQTGKNIKIIVDNVLNPQVAQLFQASFTVFAGNTHNEIARNVIQNLPLKCTIMPSPPEWIALAREIHGDKLVQGKRYSFSADELNKDILYELLNNNPYKGIVKQIDYETAYQMSLNDLQKFHFVNYDSTNSFVEKGFGYCIKINNQVVSACTSTLVCNKGVEICIISDPNYREKGLATLVASKFILHCLENNLYPNWDASNQKSVGLAKKLGYIYIDSYDVYSLR